MWILSRLSPRRKFQILGLCLISIALFLVLSLATHDDRDVASEVLGTGSVRNQGGVLGALIASGLARALGLAGAWLVPAALLAWGWNRTRLKPAGELTLRTALGAAGLLAALGLVYLLTGGGMTHAGMAGATLGQFAARLLGRIGGELALGTLLLVLGVIAFELSASSPLRRALTGLLAPLAARFRPSMEPVEEVAAELEPESGAGRRIRTRKGPAKRRRSAPGRGRRRTIGSRGANHARGSWGGGKRAEANRSRSRSRRRPRARNLPPIGPWRGRSGARRQREARPLLQPTV